MDFSEKDAARSKFKLTQRNSRGRGRGGGGRGGGGRGGRKAAGVALDLGTNEYRFRDEAEEAAAAAAALGPVQQSKGADLAVLLSQAEPFDQAYYYRARVNLAEEFGPPPEAETGGYQGLSLDLQGLATCLAALPKNQLLDTDAFSSDDDDGWGSQDSEDEDCAELPDLPPQPAVPHTSGSGSAAARFRPDALTEAAFGLQKAAAAAAAAAESNTAAAAARPAAPKSSSEAAFPRAPAVPAAPGAAAGPPNEADDLLSELLGEKAAISMKSGAAALPKGTAAGAAAARSKAPAQHAFAQQLPPGAPVSAVPKPQAPGMQASSERADNELDMLLGLSTGPLAAKLVGGATMGSERHSSKQQDPAAQSQSLEDWLDGL